MTQLSDSTWDDPCETYKALRNAYLRLISGQQESEVHYLNLGTTRIVRYSQADLTMLKSEMGRAKAECELLQGGENKGRRFAISAGSRRFR